MFWKRKGDEDRHRRRTPVRIKRRRRILGALLILVLGAAAYRYQPQWKSLLFREPPPARTEAKLEAYSLVGEVLSLEEKQHLATIKHRDIAGWMPAMTMQFPVPSSDDWARLKVGQKIRATVYVKDLNYHLAEIRPAPEDDGPTTPSPNP